MLAEGVHQQVEAAEMVDEGEEEEEEMVAGAVDVVEVVVTGKAILSYLISINRF